MEWSVFFGNYESETHLYALVTRSVLGGASPLD